MSRVKRIEESIINKIKENGGHWVELNMKNGDKLYIQRQNFESFENLSKEKFNVGLNGAKSFIVNVSIEEVANHINKNY